MAKKTTTTAEVQTEAQPEPQAQQPEPQAQPKPKMTLNQKILSVKNAVGKVYKDGTGKVGSEQKGNQKEIKYATLTNVLEKLTPALAEYGVDYVVSPVWSELAVQLMPQGFRFFSIHMVDVETGEQTEPIIYPFRLASNPEAIKADGSTFTYVTRYLLGLAFGIQTEQDPDAKEQPQQRGNQQQRVNQQPQQSPSQPQQSHSQPQQKQQKQRTFRECVNGFYATYNRGDLGGAKRTLEFVRKYWGHKDECAAEIAAMEQLDLTVWNPLPEAQTNPAEAQSEPQAQQPEPTATPEPPIDAE